MSFSIIIGKTSCNATGETKVTPSTYTGCKIVNCPCLSNTHKNALIPEPVATATMALAAAQSPATVAAMYYSNELIIIGSFFTLILGVFATMRYVPPIDVPRPITGASVSA